MTQASLQAEKDRVSYDTSKGGWKCVPVAWERVGPEPRLAGRGGGAGVVEQVGAGNWRVQLRQTVWLHSSLKSSAVERKRGGKEVSGDCCTRRIFCLGSVKYLAPHAADFGALSLSSPLQLSRNLSQQQHLLSSNLSLTATRLDCSMSSAPFSPDELSAGPLSLSLLPYGLTFHSLHLTLPGSTPRDLLIGHADPSDHHFSKAGGRGFRNQTVGRYANRLPSGRTEKDGMVLDLVDNSSGEQALARSTRRVRAELMVLAGARVCLHGGATGLDTQEWTLVSRADSKLFPSDDSAFPLLDSARGDEAIYRFLSPAGTDGFPLTLEIEGLVQVKKPEEESGVAQGVVVVVLRAKIVEDGSDGIEFGTPVNLTVHWGFNLGSFDGVEDESVKEHKLWIDARLSHSLLPSRSSRTNPVLPRHRHELSHAPHRRAGAHFSRRRAQFLSRHLLGPLLAPLDRIHLHPKRNRYVPPLTYKGSLD